MFYQYYKAILPYCRCSIILLYLYWLQFNRNSIEVVSVTPIVDNEVHSLRDFEDSYVKPLVKSIYDCLYSINHETGYQTTDILKK